jgi:outer membrane lipoprotein
LRTISSISRITLSRVTNAAICVAILVGFLITVVAGCATAPELDLTAVDKSIQPQDVVKDIEKFESKKVLWGGVIINSINVKGGTQIEVLVYPLDSNSKPMLEKSTLGRAIAYHIGYLETIDYAPGRLLTLVGTVKDIKQGVIGEAVYDYPVVTTDQIYLWPQKDTGANTHVQFGFGVLIH